MAKCRYCDNKAASGLDACASCHGKNLQRAREAKIRKNEEVEAKELRKKDEAKKKAQELKKILVQKVDAWEASTKLKLERGEKVILHQSIYVTVDSIENGRAIDIFNFAPVAKAGLDGWEVKGVIPKTEGFGLKNVSYGVGSSETWGAGIGGIVVAVYVILSKEITSLEPPNDVTCRLWAERLIRNGVDLEI